MLWFYNQDTTKFKKYPMYSWHARPASESLGKRLEMPKTLLVTCYCVTVLLCYSRLLSCPNKVNFFKKVMNWIDLFAIIPYFVTVVILNIYISYMYYILRWDIYHILYHIWLQVLYASGYEDSTSSESGSSANDVRRIAQFFRWNEARTSSSCERLGFLGFNDIIMTLNVMDDIDECDWLTNCSF